MAIEIAECQVIVPLSCSNATEYQITSPHASVRFFTWLVIVRLVFLGLQEARKEVQAHVLAFQVRMAVSNCGAN